MKTEKNDSERDELWDLLGKLDAPQPSSFFSRNVLREIRESEAAPAKRGLWRIFARPLSGAAVAGLVLAAGFLLSGPNAGFDSQSALIASSSVIGEQDFEIIAHLDDLLAYEENSLWIGELYN